MLTPINFGHSRSILIRDFSVPPRPLRNDQNPLHRKRYSQLPSLVGWNDGSEAWRLVQEPDRLTDTLDLPLRGSDRLQLARTHALDAFLREDALQVRVSSGKNKMSEAEKRGWELGRELQLRLTRNGGGDWAIAQVEVLEGRNWGIGELCVVSIEASEMLEQRKEVRRQVVSGERGRRGRRLKWDDGNTPSGDPVDGLSGLQ